MSMFPAPGTIEVIDLTKGEVTGKMAGIRRKAEFYNGF